MSKNDKKSRKTLSDKFPLTLHKIGQFCKKIKGKIYYFGNDKSNLCRDISNRMLCCILVKHRLFKIN